jgi:regulator of protease activity HflC (stomatin/prohibitin superfamily)
LGLKGVFSLLLVSVLGGALSLLRTVTGLSYVRNNEIALKVRFHSAQRERTSPYVIFIPGKYIPWKPYWVRKKYRCQGPWKLGYPGLHGGIPFVDHWPKLRTSEESEKTGETHCILKDQMEYDIVAALRWKILGNLADRSYESDDVYNAHFATRNLEASIRNSAEQCMASVLSRSNYEEFIKSPKDVCDEIMAELQAITGLWGVEIIEVGIASRRATPRTELLTQLNTMSDVLSKLDITRLEGREALVAALTGSLTLTAAQTSRAQQPEHNGYGVHKDVLDPPLGLLHGLPKEAPK